MVNKNFRKLCSCIDFIVENNLTKFDSVDSNKQPKIVNFTVSPLMLTASYSLDLALQELINELNELIDIYRNTTREYTVFIFTAKEIKHFEHIVEWGKENYENYDVLQGLINFWCARLSKAVGYGSYMHSFCPEHPEFQVTKIYGRKDNIEYYCGRCDGRYTREEYEHKINLFLKSYTEENTMFVTITTLKKLLSSKQHEKFRYLQRKGRIRKTPNGYDLGKVNKMLLHSVKQ